MKTKLDWISIKENGQPKADGWYLCFDGENYDRMLFKNGSWFHQCKRSVVGNIAQYTERYNWTNFVTHYAIINNPV